MPFRDLFGTILFSAKPYAPRFKMAEDASFRLDFESLEDFEIICNFKNEDADKVALNAISC